MNETTAIGGRTAQERRVSAASLLATIGRWVQRRFARAGQRWHLAELDPRLKSNIGVTQVDVMSKSAKPFWR